MALVSGASGCTTLKYLAQATKGQFELSNRAKPIDEVLKDERTPPRMKALLTEIPAIKSFGERHGIRATQNYTEYVQLDRPAAVWVVSACEPLRFESRRWGFPVVGSFTYLGWFSLDAAKSHADDLRKENVDVDLRPARAYSTLGWFRDAVLSTMIPEGERAMGELVNVVLHESVHATLYLNDQSIFNESVASFVADKITPEYLRESRGAEAPEVKAWLKDEEEGAVREKRFHEAYRALAALYASARPDAEKLTEKARLLEALKQDVKAKREINNATLIQFRTYGVGMAEFEVLFRACERDWPRFWAALRTLEKKGREAFGKAHQEELAPVLLGLAREGCPKLQP